MGRAGPAPKPALQIVREGNPGQHSPDRLAGGVRLPATAPDEPNWRQWFTAPRVPSVRQLEVRYPLDEVEGTLVRIDNARQRRSLAVKRQKHLVAEARRQAEQARDEAARARLVARRTWRRIVPSLGSIGLLADVDYDLLVDYCVVVARIDQAERDVTVRGMWTPGERGAMKNPSTTVLNQLRAQFRHYVGQLGLSPVARDALRPPEAVDDAGSPWD